MKIYRIDHMNSHVLTLTTSRASNNCLDSSIAPLAIKAMTPRSMCRVPHVRDCGHGTCLQRLQELCDAMGSNESAGKLDLENAGFGDEGCAHIATLLGKNTFLKKLDLQVVQHFESASVWHAHSCAFACLFFSLHRHEGRLRCVHQQP
jgi:hypothetical protein